MTEMKTLNGYEIVDAAARERISTLEKLVEQIMENNNNEQPAIGTWCIDNFDDLPEGTLSFIFTFVNNGEIVRCTSITKTTYDSNYYTVTYGGYDNTIYDKEIGFVSADVGAEITIIEMPTDSIEADFIYTWLASGANEL